MARTYFSASSTTESTRTATSYADKVALTLTAAQQAATTDYFIFWSALLSNQSNTTADAKVRLQDDTGSATLEECNIESQDATDYISVGGIAKWTSAGTPADNTFSIEFAAETNGNTIGIKEAYIVILKRETGDEYAENLSSAFLASSWDDKVTLTFTPGSSGDYLFIGSCNLQPTSTSEDSDVRLLDNGGSGQRQRTIRSHDTTNFFPDMLVYKGSSLSGSQTWKLQGQYTAAGFNGCRMKNARLLALRLDTFEGTPQYAESNSGSTKTGAGSDSHSTKASLTFTPAAVDHLIISTSRIGGSSTSVSVAAQVAEDGGALQAEMLKEPNFSDTSAPLRESHHLFHIFTPTNASHTYATQYRNETTAITGAIAESAIAVLQLESAGGSSVTGTSAITLPSVTTDATGAVGAVGTAAITLSALTVAGTGKEGFTATAATTLPSITTDGTGKAGASGTASISLSPVTVSGTGTSGYTGTADITLSPVTVSGEGAEGFSGTGAVTLPSVTASGTGKTGASGTADITLPSITSSGTGKEGFTATADVTLPAITVSASGTHAEDNAVTGEADISLPSIMVTATGLVVPLDTIRPGGGLPQSYEEWLRETRKEARELQEEDAPSKVQEVVKIGVAQPRAEVKAFVPSPRIETGLEELTKSEIRRRARLAKRRRQEDDWFLLN